MYLTLLCVTLYPEAIRRKEPAMKTADIREFPVTVECPKDFIRRKVWVRELTVNETRFLHPNGCDNYCPDPVCRNCLTSVYKTVMSDR